ncbi:MAG: peptide chain release factor-like protein [Planctomycetota bacterium]|nr:peptide chain release factor-like protein [Planctomycetota bacterium]
MHPAEKPLDELVAECEIRRVRRSGPGGQRRNKVETGVQLVHRPTQLTVEASERRSAVDNRRIALKRLRIKLAITIRQPTDLAGLAHPVWLSRCRRGRIQVSESHEDIPVLLAAALDSLASADWDTRVAAEHLGCTTSQLVRFLKTEPNAFERLNLARVERGLRRLA